MASIEVSLRNIPDTQAAVAWAGGHTLVVDRPDGTAGGRGLGFNGGQLMALALGGCFCNDLRYAAHALGIPLDAIVVDVTVRLDGKPLVAVDAEVRVRCTGAASADLARVIRHARENCTVANSMIQGVPVDFHTDQG